MVIKDKEARRFPTRYSVNIRNPAYKLYNTETSVYTKLCRHLLYKGYFHSGGKVETMQTQVPHLPFIMQRFLIDSRGKVEICARSLASKEQRTETQS